MIRIILILPINPILPIEGCASAEPLATPSAAAKNARSIPADVSPSAAPFHSPPQYPAQTTLLCSATIPEPTSFPPGRPPQTQSCPRLISHLKPAAQKQSRQTPLLLPNPLPQTDFTQSSRLAPNPPGRTAPTL